MNYTEVERQLITNVNGLKICYANGENFITPNIVGFVHLNKDIKVEISYGKFLNDWIVGATVFKKNIQLHVEKRGIYDKAFQINDIEGLNKHIDFIKENINLL